MGGIENDNLVLYENWHLKFRRDQSDKRVQVWRRMIKVADGPFDYFNIFSKCVL